MFANDPEYVDAVAVQVISVRCSQLKDTSALMVAAAALLEAHFPDLARELALNAAHSVSLAASGAECYEQAKRTHARAVEVAS